MCSKSLWLVGGWLRPILVFSLSLNQAEQKYAYLVCPYLVCPNSIIITSEARNCKDDLTNVSYYDMCTQPRKIISKLRVDNYYECTADRMQSKYKEFCEAAHHFIALNVKNFSNMENLICTTAEQRRLK